MPYISTRAERMLLVRWTGTPTSADVDSLLRTIGAANAAAGARVLFLAIVPDGSDDMPPPEAREAFNRALPKLSQLCESIDLVVEGKGVSASLVRTIIRGMSLAVRGARVGVHASFEAALARIGAAHGFDAAQARKAAQQGGILG